MRKIIFILVNILIVMTSPAVLGFQPFFQGSQSIAMGSAYSGFNNNAEVVWINPAAIASIHDSYSISSGIVVSQSYTKFQQKEPSLYQAASNNKLQFPAYLYLSAALNERLSLGLAIHSAYSDNIKWQEENWAGQFIVKETNLDIITYQPALAYALTENISLGFGLIMASADLSFKRSVPLRDVNHEGDLSISGNALQYGFNAGIFIRPHEDFSLGLSYKSAMKQHFNDADAAFSVPASLLSFFPDNNAVNTTYHLPGMLDFSGGWRMMEDLNLAWGLGYIFCKNTGNSDFDFRHNSDYLHDFSITRNNKDKVNLKLGAEYQTAEYLVFRAGIFYQTGSVNEHFFSPANPSLPLVALASGVSIYAIEHLIVDLSFAYIAGIQQRGIYAPANFGGKYKSASYSPSIGVSYAL